MIVKLLFTTLLVVIMMNSQSLITMVNGDQQYLSIANYQGNDCSGDTTSLYIYPASGDLCLQNTGWGNSAAIVCLPESETIDIYYYQTNDCSGKANYFNLQYNVCNYSQSDNNYNYYSCSPDKYWVPSPSYLDITYLDSNCQTMAQVVVLPSNQCTSNGDGTYGSLSCTFNTLSTFTYSDSQCKDVLSSQTSLLNTTCSLESNIYQIEYCNLY